MMFGDVRSDVSSSTDGAMRLPGQKGHLPRWQFSTAPAVCDSEALGEDELAFLNDIFVNCGDVRGLPPPSDDEDEADGCADEKHVGAKEHTGAATITAPPAPSRPRSAPADGRRRSGRAPRRASAAVRTDAENQTALLTVLSAMPEHAGQMLASVSEIPVARRGAAEVPPEAAARHSCSSVSPHPPAAAPPPRCHRPRLPVGARPFAVVLAGSAARAARALVPRGAYASGSG